MDNTKAVSVKVIVNAPIEMVWKSWTTPADIIKWNSASEDWHTPRAENDLRVGGNFFSRMEAKDGSVGFDFEGKYQNVVPHQLIEYVMPDGRKVKITFTELDYKTEVLEIFDPEEINSIDLQRMGWQSILDNFKKYTESKLS